MKKLQQVWSHAGVGVARKIELFNAIVVSRLVYGLSTIWLVSAQRKRLDGFFARCLRQILKMIDDCVVYYFISHSDRLYCSILCDIRFYTIILIDFHDLALICC